MTYTLTGEQLGELLELMAYADSVELKLTVPESDHYSVAAPLGMDPLDDQIRAGLGSCCGRGECKARAATAW
jgi:hypothetical protein